MQQPGCKVNKRIAFQPKGNQKMKMHRKLLLAAVLVLMAVIVAIRSDIPVAQAGPFSGDIKAEVRGILHFQEGKGYFITAKSGDDLRAENIVWLWITENKILVKHLNGLVNLTVTAKGHLEQMPKNVRGSVPPDGMYLKKFEIEAALPFN
jgi:hypothetical protein